MPSAGGVSEITRDEARAICERAIEAWARAEIRGDYPPVVLDLEALAERALHEYRFVVYRAIEQREGVALRAEKPRWMGVPE